MHKHCKTDIKVLMKSRAKKTSLDCNNYMKNIVPITLPRDKIIFINKTRKKSDFTSEIKALQNLHKRKYHEKKSQNWDYLSTLPEELHKRVANIIPLVPEGKYFLQPEAMQIAEKAYTEEVEKEKNIEFRSEKTFNESTCSLILKMQPKFTELNLKTEQSVYSLEKKRNVNWYSEYICEPKEKRVKWKTKLYNFEKDISEKSPDEQAEEIMEAASERFSNWLNSHGTSDTNITKEYIRTLFNIDGGAKLLGGVKIDPKDIKSVPHNVAKTWGMPQMSMTNQFKKKLAERKAKIPKVVIKESFGRTIPYRDRPWTPSGPDTTIQPYCPEVLLTRSKLFDGILHLKSTKELINYLKENSDIERPEYLQKQGLFEKMKIDDKIGDDSIPLYELFEMAQSKK